MKNRKYLVSLIIVILILCMAGCAKTADEQIEIDATQQPMPEQTDQLEDTKVVTLTTENFDQVIDENHIVLVDFWAAWCGPCLQLAPYLDEVASEYDVILGKVNVDEQQELASEYGITGIPDVYLFVDGEMKQHFTGMSPVDPKERYIQAIKEYQ